MSIPESNSTLDDPRHAYPDTIRVPPETLGSAFRMIGPGLILAAAIVGTGELIQTTQLGAKAGFVLLWLVLVSCFIKVFVQVELGRYAVSSGRSTFEGFRSLPGPGTLLVYWCVLMLFVTQLQIGAMIGGISQALHMIAPGIAGTMGFEERPEAVWLGIDNRPELVWALPVTLVTIAMLVTGSYRLIERVTIIFVVGFTFVTIACVAMLPLQHAITWSQVGSGLTFRVPAGTIGAAFAMFGITGVGATELLTYPYWCTEKGYARFTGPRQQTDLWAERAKGWLRVMQLDAWVSMVVYTIATLAFFLLGAAILHEHTDGEGLPGTVGEMLNVLVQMYEPVLGPSTARWFLVIGAFAVLYSTLFAATAGTSRLLADAMRVNRLFDPARDDLRLLWVRIFCVALPLLGLSLFIGVGNPILMVMIGGIMQGVTLPLIAFAAVFLRYKRTDQRLTSGTLWDVFLWLSMLGLAFTGIYSLISIIWESVQRFQG